MSATALQARLDDVGYLHLPGIGQRGLVDVLEALGDVVHVEEVVRQAGSGALVKSGDGIAFHTDHHRARCIVWICFAQASGGGLTQLVDGRRAAQAITAEQRAVLRSVRLMEHAVFRGDVGDHPMLAGDDDALQIYWSLWFADRVTSQRERGALDAFAAALHRAVPTTIAWQRGDVVVVDNSRMLHGRTPIVGDGRRHLRRYWLA